MDWNTNNVAKRKSCTKIDFAFDKISQLQVVKMPNTLLWFHSAWTTTPQFDSEATFVVCHALFSSLSIGPIRLGFHLARPVTVCGLSFGTSFLSFKGSYPVSDVILHTFPWTGPQCFWLSLKTLNAVVFLRDLVSFNEAHHVSLNSENLCFLPFMYTAILGSCRVKGKRVNLCRHKYKKFKNLNLISLIAQCSISLPSLYISVLL